MLTQPHLSVSRVWVVADLAGNKVKPFTPACSIMLGHHNLCHELERNAPALVQRQVAEQGFSAIAIVTDLGRVGV